MQSNMTLNVDFVGGIHPDGVPANLEGGNRHIDTKGGYIAPSNTVDAHFGRIVSVDPAFPDAFLVGWTNGQRVVGPLLNDQGIRENDPAKADYILNQQPATAVIKGALWFGNWQINSQLGLIAPSMGCVVVFNESTGLIGFMADGTVAFPAGYKPLLAAVVSTNQATGVCVDFLPQTFAILPTEDVT